MFLKNTRNVNKHISNGDLERFSSISLKLSKWNVEMVTLRKD